MRFIGIDLGGSRGKTTALCELVDKDGVASVVALMHRAGAPLNDDALWTHLAQTSPADTIIAIAAPLTQPSCERCPRATCPGATACEEPSVQLLVNEHERRFPHAKPSPYSQRLTDLHLVFGAKLLPVATLSGSNLAIRGRALQLRRRLASLGYTLNRSLLEVSPFATVAALCTLGDARGYKRDPDPWRTRALVLSRLREVQFAPSSRFAREEVLQNDHRFDALICAYTAFLRQRDNWRIPEPFAAIADDDGWIWAPPAR